MPKKPGPEILAAVEKRLADATRRTGTISALLATGIFGVGFIFLSASTALGLAVGTLGACGGVEAFHAQREAKLHQRCKASNIDSLFFAILHKFPKWEPKVIQQISHGVFRFNVIGFEHLPTPLGLSEPICPACGHPNLAERAHCLFPGRIRIRLLCACGWTTISLQTIAELRAEAADMARLPK